ncbi:MAG: glycosyltransferase family 4 protein [Acidimicrobiales bacterium]
MRLLFVVQRYGRQVAGGAELCCRQFATRLARRGHDVDVLTTCALSYVDWANVLPPGVEQIDGVNVHRLAVRRPRNNELFGLLNARTVAGRKPVPLYLQVEWMRAQGPLVEGIAGWLEDRATGYDAVVFFTYLYYTTWAGLPAAAGRVPTILHPTAHDEPPLYLPLFDMVFRLPDAFGYLTEEEGDLVRRRFRVNRPSKVVGIGVELDAEGDAAAFRQAFGLGDRPYLVYVGRLDPHKGTDELYEFFAAYKRRNPGPLALVVVGEPVKVAPEHDDLVVTGFVDESVKRGAIEGALALVHPSYFESFSMVLTEAWAQRKPALVQGHCEVLAGQARRSGGALPYVGYAEFEAALDLLVGDPALQVELGRSGRRYVEQHYAWDHVLDGYEELLSLARATAPEMS